MTTLQDLHTKHRRTIDELGRINGIIKDPGTGRSAECLRFWCDTTGVKDAAVLSLDDALEQAGKLLFPPKPPDALPSMPWTASGERVYDTHINIVVDKIGKDWTNASKQASIISYIAKCGTQDVRLIVESGLAPTIAEALRRDKLFERVDSCGHIYKYISLPKGNHP